MRSMLAGWVALAIASTAAAGVSAADEPVAEKAAAVAATKGFTPPDGWRPKKRGQFTVYCRKDYNVKGTRFPAETCYDEAGIRAMLEAQREDQTQVDQMRRICGSDATCGAH
jgi:hypothetical protein